MRAANIFGPALMRFSFNESFFTIFLEKNPSTLYFEKPVERNKKSTAKKAIRKGLKVKTKESSNNTVNVAFRRATRSLILLFEMGQMA